MTTILPTARPEDNLDAEETLLDLESGEAIIGRGCPINPDDRESCEACQ